MRLTGFGPVFQKLGCSEHDSHVDEVLQLVGCPPFDSAQCAVSSAHHDFHPKHQAVRTFDLPCRSLEFLGQPMERGYFLQLQRSEVAHQPKDSSHRLGYQRASLAFRRNRQHLSPRQPSIAAIVVLPPLSSWPGSSWTLFDFEYDCCRHHFLPQAVPGHFGVAAKSHPELLGTAGRAAACRVVP